MLCGARQRVKRGDAHPDGFGCSTDVKGTTAFFLIVVFFAFLAILFFNTVEEPFSRCETRQWLRYERMHFIRIFELRQNVETGVRPSLYFEHDSAAGAIACYHTRCDHVKLEPINQ